MTDEIQGGDIPVNVDVSATADSPVPEVSSEAESAPIETPIAEEKTLTQSQANKIIAREKREYAKKYEAEYQAKLAHERNALLASQSQPPSQGYGMTQEQIQLAIRQEAQKMSTESKVNDILTSFDSKIRQEIARDPDFADDYDALNIEAHPGLVLLTNQLDNTAEVIKELAKNPTKFSTVLMLANSGSHEMAKRELQRLSSSIKTNKAAENYKKAPAPLGQIKSSNVLTNDGKASVTSFRAKFKG